MGLIIGKPKTAAGAQLRLKVPIAILSAFLNNTPIVAVMIPLTLCWAKNIGVHKQQLLIPLSYATILGGICTLVGTSTNLVVSGLLEKDYPDSESANIGLFDVAIYGIPNTIIGLACMLVFSPFLLPQGGTSTNADVDDFLLGARVTPWSPADNRTVKRSGLGNSGGIRRAATGNIHRAVSKDFVISVGDELYFTATVEEFAAFCEKHGLEIITTENITAIASDEATVTSPIATATKSLPYTSTDEEEQLRLIYHLTDQIEGREPVETGSRPAKIILAHDSSDRAILVGVDCSDRSGLLMDISSALFEQGLKLRHSEAKVIEDRSLSLWRCEVVDSAKSPELESIWTALDSLLGTSSLNGSVMLNKKSGTPIVRAIVPNSSSLIGKKPILVDFRRKYKPAVVAYQKNGKNSVTSAEHSAGDLLVLETIEGLSFLQQPQEGFYNKTEKSSSSRIAIPEPEADQSLDNTEDESDLGTHMVWRDLKVIFDEHSDDKAPNRDVPKGEFLTAFVVPPGSPFENKSLNELGYSKLPGVILVSIERPIAEGSGLIKSPRKGAALDSKNDGKFTPLSSDDPLHVGDVFWFSGSAEAIGDLRKIHGLVFHQEDEMKKAASSLQERRLRQAVVARGSPLVRQTVQDVHFRSQYGGAVITIQRGSERVHEHPGYVTLQTGNVLLVEAGPAFVEKHSNNYRTFALVSEVENSAPPRPRLFLLCVFLTVASLIVAALDYRSLLITAAMVAIIIFSLGIVTQQEARDALQWDLYLVVGAAFGIGNAMENSGVAEGLATFLVNVGRWIGIGGKFTNADVFVPSYVHGVAIERCIIQSS
jgi:K+/H+ antiporter YhaU regulatory subunit KhtT